MFDKPVFETEREVKWCLQADDEALLYVNGATSKTVQSKEGVKVCEDKSPGTGGGTFKYKNGDRVNILIEGMQYQGGVAMVFTYQYKDGTEWKEVADPQAVQIDANYQSNHLKIV